MSGRGECWGGKKRGNGGSGGGEAVADGRTCGPEGCIRFVNAITADVPSPNAKSDRLFSGLISFSLPFIHSAEYRRGQVSRLKELPSSQRLQRRRSRQRERGHVTGRTTTELPSSLRILTCTLVPLGLHKSAIKPHLRKRR